MNKAKVILASSVLVVALLTAQAWNQHNQLLSVTTTLQVHTEQIKRYQDISLQQSKASVRGTEAVESLVLATTALTETTNKLVIAVSRLEATVYRDK